MLMKKHSLLHFFKVAFLLASCSFVACNLFNPTSSGDVPNNKEALVSEAFSAYRDAKYEDALENFDKALKKDSTLSEAYLGAVKAIMGMHNINVFTMIECKFNDFSNLMVIDSFNQCRYKHYS